MVDDPNSPRLIPTDLLSMLLSETYAYIAAPGSITYPTY